MVKRHTQACESEELVSWQRPLPQHEPTASKPGHARTLEEGTAKAASVDVETTPTPATPSTSRKASKASTVENTTPNHSLEDISTQQAGQAAPESPRKSMLKRKRSQTEVGHEDAAKRPKTSKPKGKKAASKAAQENAGDASTAVKPKVAKPRTKSKGKKKADGVAAAEGGVEVEALSASVVYRIPNPGSEVQKGYLRIPPRFDSARRTDVASG